MTDQPEPTATELRPELVRISLKTGYIPVIELYLQIPDEASWANWLRTIRGDGFIATPGFFIPFDAIACIVRVGYAQVQEGGNVVRLR